MDKRKSLADKSFFAWIGIIASLIAIYAFITGNQDIHDELYSYFSIGQPTVLPTIEYPPIPDTTILAMYFGWVNQASSKNSQYNDTMLSYAWEFTTEDYRCKEFTQCGYEAFRDYWLTWKVQATLYECGSSIVDAEQTYYPKDETSGLQPVGPIFRRYIMTERPVQIKEAVDIQGPCILYISKVEVTP